MIIESCIGAQQRTLYVSGAFGYEPELPQLLADALDRDILVVDESHLPAIGAAAMCVDVLEGNNVTPPQARLVRPRPEWRSIVAERWQQYRQVWSTVTGTLPLSTLDETIEPLIRQRIPNRNHSAPPGASSRDDVTHPHPPADRIDLRVTASH